MPHPERKSSPATARSSSPRTLKFGVVGIGRMGQRHALNLLRRIPNAELVCACSPAQADLDWAQSELVPYGVEVFKTFEEMIEFPGLQAVVIASLTTLHYHHTVESLNRSVHVLCEKPVCFTLDELDHLIHLTETNPQTRLMVGFTRRFDESYDTARKHIQSGALGQPLTFRSHAAEPLSLTPFTQSYFANCGGIFFDSVIHDIDLSLMFLSATSPTSSQPLSLPRQCHALGLATAYPHLRSAAQHERLVGDADNALGVVQFWSGQVAWYYNSRTGPVSAISGGGGGGYDNSTSVVCEKGKVDVNLEPRRDRVSVHDSSGVGFGVLGDWYERYKEGFVTEVAEFVEVVLGGLEGEESSGGGAGKRREFRTTLQEVRVGLEIALALQESLEMGGVVWFDEKGMRLRREGGVKGDWREVRDEISRQKQKQSEMGGKIGKPKL